MSQRKGTAKSKGRRTTAKKAGKKAGKTTAKKATKKAAKKAARKPAARGKAKASAKKAARAGSAKATARRRAAGPPPVAKTPPHDATQLRSIVSRYVAAYNARDVPAILALYHPKATMADPIGLPPAVGHAEIATLYQMGFDMDVTIANDGAVRCAGSSVAFPLVARSPSSRLDVIDVFDFGQDGRIVQMRAYWGPANLQGDLAVRQ